MVLFLLLARGLAVGTLLLAFGGAVFAAGVLPRALAKGPAELAAPLTRRGRGLVALSLAVALLASPCWAAAQAGVLLAQMQPGGAPWGETLVRLPEILLETRFGEVALFGAAFCGLALLALWRSRLWLAALLAGVAVASHAGHLHGYAMQGAGPLAAVEALHLLAAGAWLGGLAGLLWLVAGAPPGVAATACRWFSPLGKLCVGGMAASALCMGGVLTGSLRDLVVTDYGRLVAVKIALFGVLLGFAGINRYRLAPALGISGRGRRALYVSLALQLGAGLLAVGCAVVLSGLEPTMAMSG
jgi:putative copper export protein